MSNTLGKIFRLTTWGESHGRAIGAVIDGCPSMLELSEADIQKELDMRRPGRSSIASQRKEEDKVEILSGVFEGRTTGAPLSMLIWNRDVRSDAYDEIKNLARPGHADLTYELKYGMRDWRGGGRASARETACRVAGGAVAKKLLSGFGMEIFAYAVRVGGIPVGDIDVSGRNLGMLQRLREQNSVRCIDAAAAKKMENAIMRAKNKGDSLGGVIEATALGVPPGLGEPVFDKLGADLAKALMSIPAVKGVEIGAGFRLADMRGSESNDAFFVERGKIKTKTNNSGGILGGISSGMPVVMRVAIKPTSSIAKEQDTVDMKKMQTAKIKVGGRHDPCVVPRAVPVVEAMVALVLADHGVRSGAIPRVLK